jgi:hypothetical protein
MNPSSSEHQSFGSTFNVFVELVDLDKSIHDELNNRGRIANKKRAIDLSIKNNVISKLEEEDTVETVVSRKDHDVMVKTETFDFNQDLIQSATVVTNGHVQVAVKEEPVEDSMIEPAVNSKSEPSSRVLEKLDMNATKMDACITKKMDPDIKKMRLEKSVLTRNRPFHGKPMIQANMRDPSRRVTHDAVAGAPIFGPFASLRARSSIPHGIPPLISKAGVSNTADATRGRRGSSTNPPNAYETNNRAKSFGRGKHAHMPDWLDCQNDGLGEGRPGHAIVLNECALEKENIKPVATQFSLPPPSGIPESLPVASGLGRGKNDNIPAWMTRGDGIYQPPLMPRESRPPLLKARSKRDGIEFSCESLPVFAKSLPVRAPIVGLTPTIAVDRAHSKPLSSSGGLGRGKNINLPAWMTHGDSIRSLHGAVKNKRSPMAAPTRLSPYPTSAIIPPTHPELLPYSNVRELDKNIHFYDGEDFGMLLPPLISRQAVENWLASTGVAPLVSVKEDRANLDETERTNPKTPTGIAAEGKIDSPASLPATAPIIVERFHEFDTLERETFREVLVARVEVLQAELELLQHRLSNQ